VALSNPTVATRPASPWRRIAARLLELPVGLVVVGVMWAVGWSVSRQSSHGDEIAYTAMGAGMFLVLVYEVVGIALWGQTLGKRFVGIRVVRAGMSSPPGIGWSILRFAMLYGAGCWISSVVSLVMVFTDKRDHRGLHDLVGKTQVVMSA
jgi:uncharacterized RDD family membrane protein YckC